MESRADRLASFGSEGIEAEVEAGQRCGLLDHFPEILPSLMGDIVPPEVQTAQPFVPCCGEGHHPGIGSAQTIVSQHHMPQPRIPPPGQDQGQGGGMSLVKGGGQHTSVTFGKPLCLLAWVR